jgi:hypothetical protein
MVIDDIAVAFFTGQSHISISSMLFSGKGLTTMGHSNRLRRHKEKNNKSASTGMHLIQKLGVFFGIFFER